MKVLKILIFRASTIVNCRNFSTEIAPELIETVFDPATVFYENYRKHDGYKSKMLGNVKIRLRVLCSFEGNMAELFTLIRSKKDT